MAQQKSWFSEHPWMTFFLASSFISGVVHIVRPPKEERLPPLWSPPPRFPSTYPTGYELHAYHPNLKSLEASMFATLDEARAYAEPLIERGFHVAVRYVPPGYTPGDTRSEAGASIRFAQPADYNPWSSSKSPRESV